MEIGRSLAMVDFKVHSGGAVGYGAHDSISKQQPANASGGSLLGLDKASGYDAALHMRHIVTDEPEIVAHFGDDDADVHRAAGSFREPQHVPDSQLRPVLQPLHFLCDNRI